MGQSLLAAQLPSDVEAYGVDCDVEAIEAGRRLAPPNIKLVCGRGEMLPFEDEYFDLIFSRVALPYMQINMALREISRVLKYGGDVWLALHPASLVFSWAKRATRGGNLKQATLWSCVLLNGALFNSLGIQLSFRGCQETFQTFGGMARAMKRAGLTCLPMNSSRHFVVHGKKVLP
jgi:SAM-dependent methyltransferase